MNSKHPKYPIAFPALLIILLHLIVIFLGGYFLSPEFTLYPYLVSRGFLPYANIIDQHFPSLIFGPLSFPSWLTGNPFPLSIIFGALTATTDLFIFLSLVRKGNQKPLFWLLSWVVISYWFSGNTLWLESFITLYLAIIFFLGRNDKPDRSLLLGFFFALILLVKPTFFPLLVLLFIYRKLVLDCYFLTGFFLPLLLTGLFLGRSGIVADFFDLTIRFNRQFYAQYATKLPTPRQIIETAVIFTPAVYLLLSRKKLLPILIILGAVIAAFPRFEYIHLQPALLLLLLFSASELNLAISFFVPICLVLLVFFVYRNLRHNFGNFYLDKVTLRTAAVLRSRPGHTLYAIGGNDLLYVLSNRIPPGYTFLPGLPWYWKDEFLAKKMIRALADSPQTLILIKNNATLDGVNIQKSTGLIGRYIKENYQSVETIESYQVYQRILK